MTAQCLLGLPVLVGGVLVLRCHGAWPVAPACCMLPVTPKALRSLQGCGCPLTRGFPRSCMGPWAEAARCYLLGAALTRKEKEKQNQSPA